MTDLHYFTDLFINVILRDYSSFHFGPVMPFNELEFIDDGKYLCELIRSNLLQILKVLLVNFGVVKVRVLVVAGGLNLQKFKDEGSVVGIS